MDPAGLQVGEVLCVFGGGRTCSGPEPPGDKVDCSFWTVTDIILNVTLLWYRSR